MEQEIFKKSIINEEKLIEYGFIKRNNNLTYKKFINNSQFEVILTYKNNNITGKIIDKELNEEYYNYRIENNIGEFVNNIRNEYINILNDIKEKCCINKYYISDQANRISEFIKTEYNDNPEYLWDGDTNNSVFRNSINNKWYGIIMYINKNKIDKENKKEEIINLKLPPEIIKKLLLKKGYYKAYHMNKKYWITLLLDDTILDREIIELIKVSHSYTENIKEWIIPINLNKCDINNYFKNTIEYKNINNINKNDLIYFCIDKFIVYKYKVVEKNDTIKLEIIEKFPNKKYFLDNIKGIKKFPLIIANKIKEDLLCDII